MEQKAYHDWIGHKVDIYFNLHKKKWSIKSRVTNRIILHTEKACVINASFVVQESGRQRVLKEKRRNVHAFVRGEFAPVPPDLKNPYQIFYNPYHAGYFYRHDKSPVHTSPCVILGYPYDSGGVTIDLQTAT